MLDLANQIQCSTFRVILHLFNVIIFRHSGVPGGKQSPVTVGTGCQSDPSPMGNRPLVELCKLTFIIVIIITTKTTTSLVILENKKLSAL